MVKSLYIPNLTDAAIVLALSPGKTSSFIFLTDRILVDVYSIFSLASISVAFQNAQAELRAT